MTISIWSLAVLLVLSSGRTEGNSTFEDCTSKRKVLVEALLTMGNNTNELDSIFYPAGQLPSRFIQVNYHFNNINGGNCNVSYFWASGGFLLIQPPSIFVYTTLLFSYPTNDLTTINLTLPLECMDLVKVYEDNCTCLPDGSTLDRLTQQVSLGCMGGIA